MARAPADIVDLWPDKASAVRRCEGEKKKKKKREDKNEKKDPFGVPWIGKPFGGRHQLLWSKRAALRREEGRKRKGREKGNLALSPRIRPVGNCHGPRGLVTRSGKERRREKKKSEEGKGGWAILLATAPPDSHDMPRVGGALTIPNKFLPGARRHRTWEKKGKKGREGEREMAGAKCMFPVDLCVSYNEKPRHGTGGESEGVRKTDVDCGKKKKKGGKGKGKGRDEKEEPDPTLHSILAF